MHRVLGHQAAEMERIKLDLLTSTQDGEAQQRCHSSLLPSVFERVFTEGLRSPLELLHTTHTQLYDMHRELFRTRGDYCLCWCCERLQVLVIATSNIPD